MNATNLQVVDVVVSIVVCCVQIILSIAGIFGHCVILLATYKTKEIQTKYGMLLVQLSLAHIICTIGQLLNTAFLVAAPIYNEKRCFEIFAVLSSAMLWQSVIMLTISADLLCAIVMPLFYRHWSTRLCVAAHVAFCVVISTVYTLTMYWAIRPSNYDECNVYSVQPEPLVKFSRILNYVIALSQIVIYGTCYMIMHIRAKLFMKKNKNACYRNKHRKTMRTISLLIAVYTCTWVLSIVLSNIIDYINNDLWKRWMWMLVSVLQMTCFAQMFYVCYHRSSEYRSIFRRLFKSFKLSENLKHQIVKVCQHEKAVVKSVSLVVS